MYASSVSGSEYSAAKACVTTKQITAAMDADLQRMFMFAPFRRPFPRMTHGGDRHHYQRRNRPDAQGCAAHAIDMDSWR
jgi:hypothetical protein